MPPIFDDPMAAGFIWRVALLCFGWVMYSQLTNDPDAPVWWGRLLAAARLLPRGGTAGPEVMEASRRAFRVLGIAGVALTLVHGVLFYRRSNPYFLFGPTPTRFSGESARPSLPPPAPGAGGGGAIPQLPARDGSAPVGGGGAVPGGSPPAGMPAPAGAPTR